jgi:hypothetical protein
MGGAPNISGGMSAGERKDLLTYENTLAEERDMKAREYQLESERRRESQEREIRKQTELTEKQRIAELEEMEQAGIDAAPSEYDAGLLDLENRTTSMWASLGQGTSPDPLPDPTIDRPK